MLPRHRRDRLKTIHHTLNASGTSSNLSWFDYTYTPDGSITTWQRQLGNAPATLYTFDYDKADQLASATVADVAVPQTAFNRFSYHYDPAGNRVSTHQGTPVTSATHNTPNQLMATSGVVVACVIYCFIPPG